MSASTDPEDDPQPSGSPAAAGDILGSASSPHEASSLLPASYWAQQTAPAPAEHEDDSDPDDDLDSAFGDDSASSTASLSASILEYRTLHGRTYHSEIGNAQSWNPNDAQHDESMDLLHHVSTLLLGDKLFMAPLDPSIQQALDLGCGTGSWAIDFADQFPSAQVTGLDISPQQPSWVPPNVSFEIDDITREWTFAPATFDYVHARWLVGAIPDWPALFRQAFQTLKPGGGAFLESQEASCFITSDDGTVPPGSAMDQWGRVFWEAGRRSGRSFRVVEDGVQRRAMEEAGFVDICEYNYKTPIGPWSADENYKQIGLFQQAALHQDIEGFLMYMWTTAMGWQPEEVRVYAALLRQELRSGRQHGYYAQKIVIGRKP